MKKTLLAAAALMTLTFAAPLAYAEPTAKDNNYGYDFKDDILKADAKGASGAQITVIKFGRRDRLLKPRVHFVTEMLKSVENM